MASVKVSTNEDRLSCLPDSLLCPILSYVTTAESVRSSILSKRWLSVWSHVPVLDLDDSSLSPSDPSKEHATHLSFIHFLNNVLSLNNADLLQKLSLKCSKFDSYRVNKWVIAAMKRRVKELDLCVNMTLHFRLHHLIFVCGDLVDLKIGKKFVLDIPGEVVLSSLKKLHLDSIEFLDDESCRKLLCGCPVFEYLHIEECGMQNVKTLEIIAPALKSLVIGYWDGVYSAKKYEYKVFVDAPNLEVFKYESHMAKGYSFNNVDSLKEVYIDVDIDHWNKSKMSAIRKTAVELLNGISNAKFITFSGFSLKVLSFLELNTLPKFDELTKLVLGSNEYCGALLREFLANSPILKALVVEKGTLAVYIGDMHYHFKNNNF